MKRYSYSPHKTSYKSLLTPEDVNIFINDACTKVKLNRPKFFTQKTLVEMYGISIIDKLEADNIIPIEKGNHKIYYFEQITQWLEENEVKYGLA